MKKFNFFPLLIVYFELILHGVGLCCYTITCHAFWRAGTFIFRRQLYHKIRVFTYGFSPPLKNLQVEIFLSALLFLRRWCFLAVKWPSPDHARRCSWGGWCWEWCLLPAGVPSSLAPLPGCCVASCWMSLYSEEPSYLSVWRMCSVYFAGILWDLINYCLENILSSLDTLCICQILILFLMLW